MTHEEILEQTKAELDRLVSEAKRKLDDLVKPELEVGKWYWSGNKGYRVLFCYQGDVIYHFGFSGSGEWSNLILPYWEETAIEATRQNVEDALVKEAKRRGIVKGSDIKSVDGYVFKNILGSYIFGNSMLCYGGAVIFKNGKWAEVIKENRTTLDQDIKALKEKYPNLKFTITVEDNL